MTPADDGRAHTLADAIAERREISGQNPDGLTAIPNTTVIRMLAVIQSLNTAVTLGADANEWFPEPVLEALDALAAHWGIGGGDDE